VPVPVKSFVPSLWKKADNSGINYDLLRARDVPILFFDEVTLYQVRELSVCVCICAFSV
jgi:hypothetical protein